MQGTAHHGFFIRHTDLFRCLQIDYQLELIWLLHRQIARLGSLENFVHVIGYARVAVRGVRPVVHERQQLEKLSRVRKTSLDFFRHRKGEG